MRGRVQASGAAAIASALPLVSWIGAAIVALIVLRQGLKEGALVSLWAALPLIVAFQVGGDCRNGSDCGDVASDGLLGAYALCLCGRVRRRKPFVFCDLRTNPDHVCGVVRRDG